MARHSLRRRIIAAILSPLLAFALLEAGLRIAGFRYVPREPFATGGGEAKARHVFRMDPEFLWTLRPSSVIHDPSLGFVAVCTNSLGLRGPEPPAERLHGEVRVLCLGDSVTFGLGMTEEETIPRLLERLLGARPEFSGRPVFVLNGGCPGWSSVQAMRLYRKLGSFSPDAIVFWLGANDVQYRGVTDGSQLSEGKAKHEIGAALGPLRSAQLVRRLADSLAGDAAPRTRVSLAEYAEAVRELSARAAGGGPPVVFVRYPNQLARTIAKFERILARGEQAGMSVVAAPRALLSLNTPGPPEADLTGRVVQGPSGPMLRFAGAEPAVESVELIRSLLDTVRGWDRALTERLASLPLDSPGFAELFGDADPEAVFIDNFHLTPHANRLAAEALAERIAALLAKR